MTRHASPLDVPTVVLDETGRPLSRGVAYTAAEAAGGDSGTPDLRGSLPPGARPRRTPRPERAAGCRRERSGA